MRAVHVLDLVVGSLFLALGLFIVALLTEAFSVYNACLAMPTCSTAGVSLTPILEELAFGIAGIVGGIVLIAVALHGRKSDQTGPSSLVTGSGCGRRYRVGQTRFCLNCGARVA
jgi:hypothetical protein